MKTEQKIKFEGTWGVPTNRKLIPVDHFYPKGFKYPVCNRMTLGLTSSGIVKKRGFSKCGGCGIVLKTSEKYGLLPIDKNGLPARNPDGTTSEIGYEDQQREIFVERPEKKLISFFCKECKKFFGKYLLSSYNIEMPECPTCEIELVRMDMKKS